MKQQKRIQAKVQQCGVTTEIRTLLTNKITCYNSFKSQNPQTAFAVLNIKDASGFSGATVFSVPGTGLLSFT